MSIYGNIGGAPAVRAAVDDFSARILAGTLTALGVPEDTIGHIGGALAPLHGDIVTAR